MSADAAGALDLSVLRKALGTYLTGVTIVTTVDDIGRRWGFTANSFTSVSLDPPLVLFCINAQAPSHGAFSSCSNFAVNILSCEQLELAQRFAKFNADKFAGLDVLSGVGGSPILPASSAWIDCIVHQRIAAGDHLIVVGRVLNVAANSHLPLGYNRGSFLSLAPERAQPAAQGGPRRVEWLIDTGGGQLLLLQRDSSWKLPRSSDASPPRLDEEWLLTAAKELASTDSVGIPWLFSVYDDPADGKLTLIYRCRVDASTSSAKFPLSFVDAEEAIDFTKQSVVTNSVIKRFVRERDEGTFGIYSGTAERGRVVKVKF